MTTEKTQFCASYEGNQDAKYWATTIWVSLKSYEEDPCLGSDLDLQLMDIFGAELLDDIRSAGVGFDLLFFEDEIRIQASDKDAQPDVAAAFIKEMLAQAGSKNDFVHFNWVTFSENLNPSVVNHGSYFITADDIKETCARFWERDQINAHENREPENHDFASFKRIYEES